MLRNRVLTLLGGCLLLGSAALADDLGYVDCASHPEETQLFAKARKSQDVVGTLPCGERFKIVLYGFIFSEVQTADGKVGYVYSSILTIDRGGTLQVRAASPDNTPRLSAASETTKIPADPKPAQPKRAAAASSLPAPAPASAAPAADAAAAASAANSNSTAAQPVASQADVSAPPVAPAAAATPVAESDAAGSANGSATTAATPTETSAAAPSSAPTSTATADQLSTNNLPTPPTTQAAAEAAADAALAAAATPNAAPATNAPVTPATGAGAPPAADSASTADATSAAAPATEAPAAAEPQPAPAPRPQPNAPVEPGTPSPKVTRESWEKPNPGGKNTSLLEFFGGFAYARTNDGGGVSNNFVGGLGSFGINLKPWLQITGDSSYNYYNVTGTKYVLYGNHYGPRIFWRRHNPLHKMFGITPFGEALFGGSREDVHWPASGGYTAYTTSASTFSWKVGGGIDMHASRLFEIRLIDVDYYRTSFGTGMNQSNYWVSTGIVLRLFRGWSD